MPLSTALPVDCRQGLLAVSTTAVAVVDRHRRRVVLWVPARRGVGRPVAPRVPGVGPGGRGLATAVVIAAPLVVDNDTAPGFRQIHDDQRNTAIFISCHPLAVEGSKTFY